MPPLPISQAISSDFCQRAASRIHFSHPPQPFLKPFPTTSIQLGHQTYIRPFDSNFIQFAGQLAVHREWS